MYITMMYTRIATELSYTLIYSMHNSFSHTAKVFQHMNWLLQYGYQWTQASQGYTDEEQYSQYTTTINATIKQWHSKLKKIREKNES